MTGEIAIEYLGNKLDVEYQFSRGKGFISREIPPDENELDILSVKLANGVDFPLDDTGTRWDIEMMVIEKIRD